MVATLTTLTFAGYSKIDFGGDSKYINLVNASAALSEDWFQVGFAGDDANDRTLNTYRVTVFNGRVQMIFNGSGVRLRQSLTGSTLTLSDGTNSLAVVGIGDRINPIEYDTGRVDDFLAFFNAVHEQNANLTLTLDPASNVRHATGGGLPGGQTALGADTGKIEPTIHPAGSSPPSGPSAVSSDHKTLLAIELTPAATAVGPSAAAVGAHTRIKPASGAPVSGAGAEAAATLIPRRLMGGTLGGLPSAVSAPTGKVAPLVKTAGAVIPSGPASLGARGVKRELEPPTPPLNVEVSDITQTSALVRWQEPLFDGFAEITGYEYQFAGSGWTTTGAGTERVFRLTGLAAGNAYVLRIRAVNRKGASTGSDPFVFQSGAILRASAPRFPRADAITASVVEVSWQAPADDGGGAIDHYEVRPILPDGTIAPFEATEDASLSWRVRGLADGMAYGFQIRPINGAGAGLISETASAVVRQPVVAIVGEGQRVPLLPEPARQSLILRLDDVDCRLAVWWQPWDEAWYGSIEAPVNSRVATARRLAVNAGILDRAVSPISVNIVCRVLDSADDRLEPGREAWSLPTHGLFVEAV